MTEIVSRSGVSAQQKIQVMGCAVAQEEASVLAGPREDPDAFFSSMQRVEAAVSFFTRHRYSPCSQDRC